MQTQENTTIQNQFKRKAKIGISFLSVRDEGKSVFVKITDYIPERENKQGDVNSFFNAVDLNTGEEGMIFLDGGLKAQFSQIKPENAVGRSYEIKYNGLVSTEMMINGKMTETEVNNYSVWELEN